MQDVVKAIRKAEIRPTQAAVKEMIWRPLQLAVLGKESTTELGRSEIDQVYEPLNKWLALEFKIHVPFPNDAGHQLENLSGPRLAQAKPKEYPEGIDEYTGPPTF